MSTQIIDISKMTGYQKRILDLEEKYYEKLWEIITREDFKSNLKNLESAISKNYKFIKENTAISNKIYSSMQKIANYHISMGLYELIEDVYVSPISSDISYEMKDIIINIDVKTINMSTNGPDAKSIHVSTNQCSFAQNPIFKEGLFSGFDVKFKLPKDENGKPVLTYVLQVLYRDKDGKFELNRKYPRKSTNGKLDGATVQLACVPNGNLSNLFEHNLFASVKTYKYYDEDKSNEYFNYKVVNSTVETVNSNWNHSYIKDICSDIGKDWCDYNISSDSDSGLHKRGLLFYDSINKIPWKICKQKDKPYIIKPVESTHSIRFDTNMLDVRCNSKGTEWSGYNCYRLD